MDFKSWMEKHESQNDRVNNIISELCEKEDNLEKKKVGRKKKISNEPKDDTKEKEVKPKKVYKKRNFGVASGADVARELGVTRALVKQVTNRAISKIYASVKALNIDDLNSPLQIVVQIAMMFGILDNQQGLRDLVNNLSKEQKKELFNDIQDNYPEYAKLMKVKI